VYPCSGKSMRGRILPVAALVVSAIFAWVAAPALSLRPYIPEVENFERALPPPKRLAAHEPGRAEDDPHGRAHEDARFISPPITAPHEFDLVGVAREMRHLEIRVRDDGGEWSEWVEQTEGTPVYVDGADEAQVRAEFRPSGRLHFVNVSGTAGGFGSRLLSTVRGGINEAFISLASAPVAEALAPKPSFVVRSAWGADVPENGCVPPAPPELGEVRAGVIHHTVNANDYDAASAPGIVLGICSFHIQGNGWNDIGYNALVDRFGTLYEGRAGGLSSPVVGAHAQGFNSQTTSIASIGEHSATTLSPEAQLSVIRYLAWRLGKAGLNPVTKTSPLTSGGGSLTQHPAGAVVSLPRVIGHRDLGLTECPGEALASQIETIRRQVQKRIKKYAKGNKKKKKGKRKKKGGKKKRQVPAR
jgi:hypothetical protein